MSIDIRVSAKTESIISAEAQFYGVSAAALAKAILDKVATTGITRDVLQGVDVSSYQHRGRGRPKTKGVA